MSSSFFSVFFKNKKSWRKFIDRMSYTMAAVSELQRFADIAPSGIPHKVLTGVKLEGYDLPAGTSVLANLHACHRYGH